MIRQGPFNIVAGMNTINNIGNSPDVGSMVVVNQTPFFLTVRVPGLSNGMPVAPGLADAFLVSGGLASSITIQADTQAFSVSSTSASSVYIITHAANEPLTRALKAGMPTSYPVSLASSPTQSGFTGQVIEVVPKQLYEQKAVTAFGINNTGSSGGVITCSYCWGFDWSYNQLTNNADATQTLRLIDLGQTGNELLWGTIMTNGTGFGYPLVIRFPWPLAACGIIDNPPTLMTMNWNVSIGSANNTGWGLVLYVSF